MNYYYLSEKEIKQLHNELMEINTTDTSNKKKNKSISSIVTKELKKSKNSDIGILFEENLRQSLELYFKLETADISRHFFYRRIKYKNNNYVICPFQKINLEKFYIEFNASDSSCSFIEKKANNVLTTITENKNTIKYSYDGKMFDVEPPKEFEVDGFFKTNADFSINDLKRKDTYIIFENAKNIQYNYCLVEIKLNQFKIDEVISQLIEDSKIISNIASGQILYIGIVNIAYDDMEFDLGSCDELKGLNCLLCGIKDGLFCGRCITNPIDWQLIKDFQEFKETFQEFKETTEENINEMKKSISNIEKALGLK